MRGSKGKRRAAASTFAVVACLARIAAAQGPTKAQCIEANTRGQDLRRESRLSVAREQFLACADAACPALVRSDCAHRLDELDAAQPTIVFEVEDAAGKDLTAVAVSVDGKPLADSLNGAALRVDPGARVFTFTVPGQPPVSESLVLREGERQRMERVTIGAATGAAASPPPPGVSGPEEPRRKPASAGPWRTVGLVAGGAGVATMVVGGVFGLVAIAKKSDADCPQNVCADKTHLTSLHQATSAADASTVLFAAGAALTVGGLALWWLGPRPPSADVGALRVVPSIGLGDVAIRGTW
jgi:hypothetical protein